MAYEHLAMPRVIDAEAADDRPAAGFPVMAYVTDDAGELVDAFLVHTEEGWDELTTTRPAGQRVTLD